jgi:hypothetical protein
VRKDRAAAFLLAFLVISHWFLDLLTHRPDLPLGFSGSTKLGLGLWNHKVATLTVEIFIFLGAVTCMPLLQRPKTKQAFTLCGGLLFSCWPSTL